MILFARAGALGDFVLSLPVLRALTTLGPVHVVTDPRYAPLLPPGATLVPGDWIWRGAAPPHAYTVAVAFSPTTAEALRAVGLPVRAVAPRPPPGVHAVDHYAGVLVGLDVVLDRRPRVPVPVAAPPLVRPVVLAPGSGGKEKRWPLERWRRVADALGVPVVWVSGPVEAEEDWPVDAVCPDLPGLVALAAGCAAWLGPDSGPSHLAAAAGARVGVVFGVTDPACWAPVGSVVWPWDTAPDALAAWAVASSSASGFTHRT